MNNSGSSVRNPVLPEKVCSLVPNVGDALMSSQVLTHLGGYSIASYFYT